MADDDKDREGKDPSPAPDAGPAEPRDLPKWNRAKVKRKVAGSEQDAFQGGVRSVGRVARRRAPMVVLAVALAAAAVGGGVWWWKSRAESRAEATRLLAEAAAVEARGRVGDVKLLWGLDRPPPTPIAATQEELDGRVDKALAELAERAPNSGANLDAQLIRGARALRAEDGAGAKAAYEAFLAEADGDHPLRFQALEGLGLAQEATGDLEAALATYRELAGEKGAFYRDQALAHQGRVLEALGRKDEAVEVYRAYLAEFPLSDPSLARDFVRDRMIELDPESIPAQIGGKGAAPLLGEAPPVAPEKADAPEQADAPAPAGGSGEAGNDAPAAGSGGAAGKDAPTP